MQKFSTSFKVGFVLLVGLIMAVAMIIRFSANWGQDEGIIRLHADFNDATGLAQRSQVQIAGIQVGEIESISLSGGQAHIVFTVRKDLMLYAGAAPGSGYSKNGATISKQLAGILGDYYLELTPGLEGEKLNDGDAIPNVMQDSGLTGILNNAGKIMEDVSNVTEMLSKVLGSESGERKLVTLLDDLNETMKSVKGITTDNADEIASIISHIETVTENASELAQTGNQKIPELVEDLSDVVEDLKTTIQTLQSGIGDTLDSTKGGIDQLRSSIDKLDDTLASIKNVAENIENGEGTVGKLLSDDSIANEAESLLTETRALIKQGTETLEGANSLLSPISDLNVDIALRGDYLVNANAFRVDFGVKLVPSEDKSYYLGLVMDPEGTTKTQTIMTESSSTGPVYETVTTNDDSVKFSLQYARRWRWFVGRFGIIENTGGLGGDVLLFDDDWQFKFDVFAFNDNEYPRVRGTMLLYFSLFMPWEWTKTFYLSAGFDDPINTKNFDYFFGIGFRFSDNDVKSIMSMIPTG